MDGAALIYPAIDKPGFYRLGLGEQLQRTHYSPSALLKALDTNYPRPVLITEADVTTELANASCGSCLSYPQKLPASASH